MLDIGDLKRLRHAALVSILPTAAKLFGYTGKMTGNILAYVTDALGLCSAPMTAGHCAQRDRLLRECRRTLDKYAAAVAELSRKMGISSLDDYLKLHQAAEAAHVRLNEAHDRLAHHIAEHHCDVSKASNPRLA